MVLRKKREQNGENYIQGTLIIDDGTHEVLKHVRDCVSTVFTFMCM